jgi:transposase
MFALKVKQKISDGFRTTDGANTFARIRGFISTKNKQNLNILNALAEQLA